MRTRITLACTECKNRNYDTTKDKQTHPDRMETKKYCRFCKRHTMHKETKQAGFDTAVISAGNEGEAMGDTNTNAVEKAAKKSGSWFKGLKAEYKKVIWPNKDEVTRQTIAVVAVSLVVGVIIAILDMGLQYGIDFIINL